MKTSVFRKELIKIMPGYKWTVKRKSLYFENLFMKAVGIQTAGFNRLSTLQIIRREKDGSVEYEAKSAGFGLQAPWLSTAVGETLAQALRSLQKHYEGVAANYACHGRDIESARKAEKL